jgi:hypothetical protein
MSRIAKSIVAFTVLVLAVGGLFAAFGALGEGYFKARSIFSVGKMAQVTPPVIPEYKTDWVTGGGGDRYCEPRRQALQSQYPDFAISVKEPPGEHEQYYNPFKQDRYRYSCVFSAAAKG